MDECSLLPAERAELLARLDAAAAEPAPVEATRARTAAQIKVEQLEMFI